MADSKNTIGEKVKTLRADKDMSIEEVARQSKIPESVLLEIEKGSTIPPLGNIVSLAKVFEVTVGELCGDDADAPFCIVRNGDRQSVTRFESTGNRSCGYSYVSLGQQKKNRQMEPFVVTLDPAEAKNVQSNQHIGEEIIFVLEGEVEVKLYDHIDILYPGDSIYYDSTMPHIVRCHGDEPATILAVIYAKEEMIIL
jgi:mannose-6-phosphate isomerase-like protein (cupin superfamily)/DNA-binding XRE family transcriptional regulator